MLYIFIVFFRCFKTHGLATHVPILSPHAYMGDKKNPAARVLIVQREFVRDNEEKCYPKNIKEKSVKVKKEDTHLKNPVGR